MTSLTAIRELALSPALFCIEGSSLDSIFLRVFLNSVQAGRPAPISAFRVVCGGSVCSFVEYSKFCNTNGFVRSTYFAAQNSCNKNCARFVGSQASAKDFHL